MKTSLLWEQYQKDRSIENRNELILKYAPLVKRIARMMPYSYMGYVDEEDMISDGMFGLIDAIEKFDTEKAVKFETYASIRIKGAIVDQIRKRDVLSRNVREKHKKIEEVTEIFERKFHRSPTDKEIAQITGISEKGVKKVVKAATMANMVSLENFLSINESMLCKSSNQNNPADEYSKKELKEGLADAIRELSEKEQMVVSLYYYEELTLKEIGEVMDVSESRISQILSKTLSKLRRKLSREY